MSHSSSHTDPRVLRTRRLIRDALISLLQELELEKITVHRIAERATINRVTFYLHYRDIQDLLERMADDMITEIQEIMESIPHQPDARETYGLIIVKILEHIAANSPFYKVLLASKRIPVFTDRFTKLMSDVIKNRTSSSAKKVPDDIAIWYGTSAFIGTIVCWLRENMPYTPSYLAQQLSILFRLHSNMPGS
ncbi:TetR family transcriptional regulator [Paenibacillus swuensis]|uniref:TetR family transcriptional regulator n=1 Tax=Paenibacillus swuensis TaxID=1178515 RepID=A0A172TI80_9BACL|nr:TetR/AcrR family transcriptional regulator [Paenibacillus swuensis]ANE46493.1 TetR family transcriptional regulator [Paenibacillus swuensis]